MRTRWVINLYPDPDPNPNPNPNLNPNQVLPAEDVAAAVRRCQAVERDAERGTERGVLVSGAAVEATAQQAVRWLCCRRRCPLTSPDSPF